MPISRHALIALYEHTQYRVRLARGGHAVIRVHQPLPAALQLDPGTAWAFITAWNPYSQPLSVDTNRARQRRLLARLRQLEPLPHVIAGVGVGPADATGKRWREPSLFVAGISLESADTLMREFEQHAIVCGAGNEPAALHWNREP